MIYGYEHIENTLAKPIETNNLNTKIKTIKRTRFALMSYSNENDKIYFLRLRSGLRENRGRLRVYDWLIIIKY